MRKFSFFLTIFFSLLILQVAFIPTVLSSTPLENNLETSQLPVNSIRIAIYNEPNVTETSYAAGGTYTNNYSVLMGFLQTEGHRVTELTKEDILNHELLTADFDLFIMVDNLPRENIVKHVKEFWLGGGALLSFDSALPYLCYEGILIPESEGDHGWGTYFAYQSGNSNNVSSRHYITKDYDVGDKFSSAGNWMCHLYWNVLLGTSAGADTVKLANRDTVNNAATAVARDPLDKGGRVVHLPGLGNAIGVDMDGMISEAVQWLCPRPKGRILFDLSHLPYYGIDPWDDYVSSVNYDTWRNTLVSRGYTLDKLYPSSAGNLTSNNLRPYDMLFICVPEINFTASEVTAVTQWVQNGGGLIAIGENAIFIDNNKNVNYLYSNFDLEFNSVTGTNGATYFVEHPTTEDCTEITALAPGQIVYSGDAYPIWGYDATEIYVAGQEYGNGRVLLMGEVGPFRDSDIASFDNLQFAINVANWLVSWDAKVLIYTDDAFSPNYYKSPACIALNSLGTDFYLTFTDEYFNFSLTTGSWELLIINLVNYGFADSVFDNVINYIDAGGHVLMSSYIVSSNPTHAIWDKFGFQYASQFPDNDPFYAWDTAHPIFNNPFDYDAALFQPFTFYADDGDLLTVYDNATALAGYTASESADNAVIVLRNDKQTLYNGYIIDELTGDNDFNGYTDNIELWTNEISYMLRYALPTPGGIPGYDVFIVFGSIFVSLGLISIIMLKKRKS
ncbi:MAG: hypothetical protein ACFE9S_02850 [Candidatus Hermodarchaeota archaeon]